MTCGDANGTNGYHLGVFSEDVAFGHHFMATRPPYHPIRVVGIMATPVKNYKKWLVIHLTSQCTVDKMNYLEYIVTD